MLHDFLRGAGGVGSNLAGWSAYNLAPADEASYVNHDRAILSLDVSSCLGDEVFHAAILQLHALLTRRNATADARTSRQQRLSQSAMPLSYSRATSSNDYPHRQRFSPIHEQLGRKNYPHRRRENATTEGGFAARHPAYLVEPQSIRDLARAFRGSTESYRCGPPRRSGETARHGRSNWSRRTDGGDLRIPRTGPR